MRLLRMWLLQLEPHHWDLNRSGPCKTAGLESLSSGARLQNGVIALCALVAFFDGWCAISPCWRRRHPLTPPWWVIVLNVNVLEILHSWRVFSVMRGEGSAHSDVIILYNFLMSRVV